MGSDLPTSELDGGALLDKILESTYTSLVARTPSELLFTISLHFRRRYTNKNVLVLSDFPLDSYIAEAPTPSLEVLSEWSGGLTCMEWDKGPEGSITSKADADIRSGHRRVRWDGVGFDVFKLGDLGRGYSGNIHYVLVFDGATDNVGKDFFAKVRNWQDIKAKGVLTYQRGTWEQSTELYDDEEDTLILESDEIARLREDVKTFFKSETVYRGLGIPWKRGLLLTGPPGNGKTRSIKLVIKDLFDMDKYYPCLYVRTMAANEGSEAGITSIFETARAKRPCLLVLEDLDSLLVSNNLAYFLNEVDGFAKNDGILIIATTNRLHGMDEAIRNRPSRFDAHYPFDPPTREYRKDLAKKWLKEINRLKSTVPSAHAIQLPVPDTDIAALAQKIANKTDGFSFAYMKELFVSFLLIVASRDGGSVANESLLLKQVGTLTTQIQKATPLQEPHKKSGLRKFLSFSA